MTCWLYDGGGGGDGSDDGGVNGGGGCDGGGVNGGGADGGANGEGSDCGDDDMHSVSPMARSSRVGLGHLVSSTLYLPPIFAAK